MHDTYDGAWYGAQRLEGARLVRTYLRLQPSVAARLANLSTELLGRSEAVGASSVAGVDGGVDAGEGGFDDVLSSVVRD